MVLFIEVCLNDPFIEMDTWFGLEMFRGKVYATVKGNLYVDGIKLHFD